eukprot:272622-Chlamydomonas_euryale.AAC.2
MRADTSPACADTDAAAGLGEKSSERGRLLGTVDQPGCVADVGTPSAGASLVLSLFHEPTPEPAAPAAAAPQPIAHPSAGCRSPPGAASTWSSDGAAESRDAARKPAMFRMASLTADSALRAASPTSSSSVRRRGGDGRGGDACACGANRSWPAPAPATTGTSASHSPSVLRSPHASWLPSHACSREPTVHCNAACACDLCGELSARPGSEGAQTRRSRPTVGASTGSLRSSPRVLGGRVPTAVGSSDRRARALNGGAVAPGWTRQSWPALQPVGTRRASYSGSAPSPAWPAGGGRPAQLLGNPSELDSGDGSADTNAGCPSGRCSGLRGGVPHRSGLRDVRRGVVTWAPWRQSGDSARGCDAGEPGASADGAGVGVRTDSCMLPVALPTPASPSTLTGVSERGGGAGVCDALGAMPHATDASSAGSSRATSGVAPRPAATRAAAAGLPCALPRLPPAVCSCAGGVISSMCTDSSGAPAPASASKTSDAALTWPSPPLLPSSPPTSWPASPPPPPLPASERTCAGGLAADVPMRSCRPRRRSHSPSDVVRVGSGSAESAPPGASAADGCGEPCVHERERCSPAREEPPLGDRKPPSTLFVMSTSSLLSSLLSSCCRWCRWCLCRLTGVGIRAAEPVLRGVAGTDCDSCPSLPIGLSSAALSASPAPAIVHTTPWATSSARPP